MNFSRPKVANATILINQSLIVDVGETSGLDPIITHNGAKVLECLCGDDIWRIERYPLKSNNCCLALQKTLNITTKLESFQNIQIVVFMFRVMLVTSL